MSVSPPPEAVALLSDRDWRLSNLYYIIDEHGRRVMFKPNWAQESLFKTLGAKNIDLKVRQIGITTGYCMLWLDLCMFSANVAVGIVAHTKDAAIKIMRDKIRYPFDNLPKELRTANPLVTDNQEELVFANGSSIRVGVTLRSGTVQVLHVTEMGYICAHFPQRANEVVTGSMQAVHEGGIIVVESTSETSIGYFYDWCMDAQKPNTDWTFRFLPWYKEPEYRKLVSNPIEYKHETDYLNELEQKIKYQLDIDQRQFWCAKRRMLGEDVFRQFPSTPEEAFKTSVEGAYYKQEMLDAARLGRITKIPIERAILVDTWWDLGINDSMSIWFVQNRGFEIRVLDYYENSGEGFAHYAQYLQQWSIKHGVIFGKHIAPHDIKVRELGTGASRLETARDLGVNFSIAPMLPVFDGIERVRAVLPRCWFDEERCSEGITHLEHYRKQWNEKREVYENQPLHDKHSHAADSFRTGVVGMDAGIMGPQQSKRQARPFQTAAWR